MRTRKDVGETETELKSSLDAMTALVVGMPR